MSSTNLRVVLGTMEMGRRKLSEDSPCHEIMDIFLARGYTEVDTAFMYVNGRSEEIIGQYSQRSKCLIASKANPWSPEGLKYDRVLEEMRISLERLQVSSLDIFYLHAPDHNTPINETLSAVQKLYSEGKFKEFGLSNYSSWQVAEIYYLCKMNGWILPTVYQGMYNPITRMVEGELFPCLRNFGMRFYAYNPLAGGLLTGNYEFTDLEKQDREGRFHSLGKWSEAYRERFWRESVFQGILGIKQSLDISYGKDQVSMISAAFRWLNHHSLMKPEYNDGIIIGGSSPEHITDNINACEEGPLDPRVVKAFDEAWELDKGNCALYYR